MSNNSEFFADMSSLLPKASRTICSRRWSFYCGLSVPLQSSVIMIPQEMCGWVSKFFFFFSISDKPDIRILGGLWGKAGIGRKHWLAEATRRWYHHLRLNETTVAPTGIALTIYTETILFWNPQTERYCLIRMCKCHCLCALCWSRGQENEFCTCLQRWQGWECPPSSGWIMFLHLLL